MAKKTDPKPPAKPIKKKLAAKSAAVAKPAKAAAAEPVIAKVKTAAKPTAAAKPAAKPVVAKPSAPKAAKKPAKAKIERSRPLLPDEPEAAPPAAEFFYFLSHSIDPQVTTTLPAGESNGQVSSFADFAEVRQHAIDYLVDLIDRCEVRLWQIKRADAFETLEQLVREHDHPPVPAAGEETPPTPS